MHRSWDSNSNTTSTTDSTSDASGSVTGGYISIPQADSSLDGGSVGRQNIYQSHFVDQNYGPFSEFNHENALRAKKLLSLKGDSRERRQHYRGQLRLDIYLLHGYVTVHVIAGRNIHSKIQDPPNSYVVASIIPESTYLCPCKSSTYWHSSRPVFDEKISIELPNHYINRRLYIALWSYDYTLQTGDEPLGCLSFGLNRKTNDGLLSSGWFYVLEGEVGRVRHVRVLDDTPPVKSYFSLYNISKVLLCRNVNNGGFGFSVYGGDRVRICRVDPGSSAHHHSLHRDDLIVCIDGVNVTDMPPWKVANIIRNAGFYMNLMVRRGDDRKADCEQDKFNNAIIANCIKRIINNHRISNNNNREDTNTMNKNGNKGDNYKGDIDACIGRSNGEGSSERGDVFMGKMVDYGWLEDEELRKAKLLKKKESRKNVYQESFEAKKFSHILKIRASNQNNVDNNHQINNKQIDNNNKLTTTTTNNTFLEDSQHILNSSNNNDVRDNYIRSTYSDGDDDLSTDTYIHFSANRNNNINNDNNNIYLTPTNPGDNVHNNNIDDNNNINFGNNHNNNNNNRKQLKDTIIILAPPIEQSECNRGYSMLGDADGDVSCNRMNTAHVAFEEDDDDADYNDDERVVEDEENIEVNDNEIEDDDKDQNEDVIGEEWGSNNQNEEDSEGYNLIGLQTVRYGNKDEERDKFSQREDYYDDNDEDNVRSNGGYNGENHSFTHSHSDDYIDVERVRLNEDDGVDRKGLDGEHRETEKAKKDERGKHGKEGRDSEMVLSGHDIINTPKIMSGEMVINSESVKDGEKIENGEVIYLNWVKELDTIQEVTEADVRQTGFTSGCSSLLENSATASYLDESLTSNLSFEKVVDVNAKVNSIRQKDRGLNENMNVVNLNIKNSRIYTDDRKCEVVSKCEAKGLVTPRCVQEIKSQTVASLPHRRTLVASNSLRGANLKEEDKENIPIGLSSSSSLASSIKSITTPSKSSKPPFFNLFRNSTRRKKTVPPIPTENHLLSSTTSIPIHNNEYDVIKSNAGSKADIASHSSVYEINNNDNNNKININNDSNKNISTNTLNNENNININKNEAYMKDDGVCRSLEEGERIGLKRHGSFRNSAFVSKIRSAFRNKN